MLNKITNIYKQQVTRHYARVMAFAVLGMIIGGGFVHTVLLDRSTPTVVTEQTEEPVFVTEYLRSKPDRIIIPKINVDTTFVEPLGLNDDQTIEIPDSYEEVGWYKNGASPGEIGSSVILGHVDSYEGPAVFFALGQLEKGDEVQIERSDGSIAVFEVTSLERVKQSEFPTQKVYGKTDHAGLRLVTCTGLYDKGSLRYSHNLIVYAALKEGSYVSE